MTTDDQFRSLLTDWLEEQPARASDQLLDSVISALPRTRQRARWKVALRRLTIFGSSPVRYGAVAAVGLLAVAVVLGVWAVGGGGVAAPSPALTPSPAPTPTSRVLTGVEGATEAGTYVTGDPFRVRVTFTLPDGWEASLPGPNAVFLGRPGDTVEVAFTTFERVYADPCDYSQGLLDPLPGSSVDDLATALASLPSVDVTTPTPVTMGGYRGQYLTLTAPDSFEGCTLAPGGNFRVWELPLGATLDMAPGQLSRVWILDVDGQRLVIDTAETPTSSAQGNVDAQAIIDSISIEPGN